MNVLPKEQDTLKLKCQNIQSIPETAESTCDDLKKSEIKSSPVAAIASGQFSKAARSNDMGSETRPLNPLKYDIPTLLNIGRQLVPGKPFQVLSSDRSGSYSMRSRRSTSLGSRVLKERSINHQRNSSILSMSTDDGRDSFRHPRRQPINAPQGALAQINAGFARFLKEHSSPKHHRVTAGGRIVPMTLQHPAPVFKLPKTGTEAANHVKTEPLKESQGPKEPLKQEATSGNGNNTSQNRPHHGPGSKAIPIRAPPTESDRARAVSAAEHIDGQKLGQKVPTTTAPNPSNQQSRSLPSLNTGQQNLRLGTTSFDGIPIFNAAAVHQGIDQGGQLPFNTQMYPSQIIGPHIFSENLHQSLQLPVQPQASNVPGMYSLGAGYPFAATPQTAPANNGFNLISVTNYSSNAPLSGMGHDFGAKALLESAVQEYDNISNQLSGLDRYLALHTWDIDPATKKVLVEQRIELVRRLDSARVYKENLETILQTPRFETIGNGQVADQLFMTSNYGMQFSNAGTFNNYSLLQAGGYLQPGASSGSGGSAVLNPLSADAMNFNHPGRTINLGVDGLNGIYEHLQTGAEQIGTASYNWTSNKDFAMNNGPGSSNVYSMSSGNNEQPSGAGGPAASPSDLEMLYHRIERAARRKEPLEPFVKELAKLTASMNAMGIIDKHDDITQTGNHRGNLNHIESNKRQATCVGMMDPKSRSASGKVIKRPVEQEDLRSKNRGGLNAVTGQSKTAERQVSKTNLNLPISRQGKGCTCTKKRGSIETANDRSNQKTVQPQVLIGPNPAAHISVESSSRQMQVNSGCSKIRAEPPVRAKQHGNFPRFDGAADSGSLSSKPATPTTNVTSGTIVTEASADTANSRVASRALQQGHADPNPMEVRTFFQLLREEDREAIRKHEIDHPPF